MSDINNALELMPTHFCQTCGARWRQLDDGRWNLRSPGCEPCCDNGPTFNVMPLVMAYDALRGQLHDEIAANHAFRDAGGALPDEDMPTFCDRLIRERDASRACLEGKMSDLSQESPLWREWAESRHSVKQMREELERLRAENARLIGDHAAALRLVADVRAAIGDDGKRMRPELIECCESMKRDAERYRWLRRVATSGFASKVFGNASPIVIDEEIDTAMRGENG